MPIPDWIERWLNRLQTVSWLYGIVGTAVTTIPTIFIETPTWAIWMLAVAGACLGMGIAIARQLWAEKRRLRTAPPIASQPKRPAIIIRFDENQYKDEGIETPGQKYYCRYYIYVESSEFVESVGVAVENIHYVGNLLDVPGVQTPDVDGERLKFEDGSYEKDIPTRKEKIWVVSLSEKEDWHKIRLGLSGKSIPHYKRALVLALKVTGKNIDPIAAEFEVMTDYRGQLKMKERRNVLADVLSGRDQFPKF